LALTQDVYFTSDSVAQRGIVAFVADRGYLEGYTLDQRIARQLVKALEETCEALQAVTDDNPSGHLATLIVHAFRVGQQARAVFDIPSLFDDVTVDAPTLIAELPFWEGATLCNDCYAAERPPTSGPGQSIGPTSTTRRHQP